MKTAILYEDASLLVCEKPAGIAVQSQSVTTADMVSILKNYLFETTGDAYLGLVHRLDQPVQGLLVFGKTKKASAALSRQLTENKFEKEYACVVCLQKEVPQKGTLEDFLVKDGRTNCSRVVSSKTVGAKKAKLAYWIQKKDASYGLVKVVLETGRHHQIRVQMCHAGMPLCGDRKYFPEEMQQGKSQLALCAVRLAFYHPVSGKRMVFQCIPKAEQFKRFEA